MKKLVTLVILMFSMSLFAQPNPQIRVCNISGGNFWAMDLDQTDNVGFCRYGDSFVGSITLMSYFFDQMNTEAMSAILNSGTDTISSCEEAYSAEFAMTDSEGVTRDVCLFADYSFVLKETLTQGISSDFNKELRAALNHQF